MDQATRAGLSIERVDVFEEKGARPVVWRVEAIDTDGGCYVDVFSGGDAKERGSTPPGATASRTKGCRRGPKRRSHAASYERPSTFARRDGHADRLRPPANMLRSAGGLPLN